VRRYTVIIYALTALAILVSPGTAIATAKPSHAHQEPSATRTRTPRRSDPKPATAQQDPKTAQQDPEPAQQDLTAAVAPLIAQSGGDASVAVDDLSTGATAAYDGGTEFVTASIVKVDILATLLYQLQQAGQSMTTDDQYLAATMIENSDNDSASDLYADVGGPQAIDDANQVFGLTQTTVGTDGYWGLTTTTAADQIQLLRTVFTTPSPLSAASQSYIQSLMSQVEPDQQWGIPAAADPGTPFMVKNGWLPNPTLWEINSIGEIVHDGQQLLIAVLSAGNASEQAGISLVQTVAATAAGAVTSAQLPITRLPLPAAGGPPAPQPG
jgi:beta-lactamase class A